MRCRDLALVAFVLTASCRVPYPVLVGASGFVVPPSPHGNALSSAGARVAIVPDAPPCTAIGLATGVGGVRDQYEAAPPDARTRFEQTARVALRNAVADAGGTHGVVDGVEVYSEHESVQYVLLRARAFRCSGP